MTKQELLKRSLLTYVTMALETKQKHYMKRAVSIMVLLLREIDNSNEETKIINMEEAS